MRNESNSNLQGHEGNSSGGVVSDIHINPPSIRRDLYADDMNWDRTILNNVAQHNGFSPSSLSSYIIEDQDLNSSLHLEDSTVQQEDDVGLTFEYLNDAWPLRAGDWKDLSDNEIFIETNSSDKDISLSLKDECSMIKKSIRARLGLSQNEDPTIQQLFDVYYTTN